MSEHHRAAAGRERSGTPSGQTAAPSLLFAASNQNLTFELPALLMPPAPPPPPPPPPPAAELPTGAVSSVVGGGFEELEALDEDSFIGQAAATASEAPPAAGGPPPTMGAASAGGVRFGGLPQRRWVPPADAAFSGTAMSSMAHPTVPPMPSFQQQANSLFQPPPVSYSTGTFQTTAAAAVASSVPSVPDPTAGGPPPSLFSGYRPPEAHWFYEQPLDDWEAEDAASTGAKLWLPFTGHDSQRLEQAASALSESPVTVDGGRYDAWLPARVKRAAYWEEPDLPIRRCTWFRRPESDSSGALSPFDEATSDQLELHYRSTVETGTWRREIRLQDQPGTAFVFQGPTDLLQYRVAPAQGPGESAGPWALVRGTGHLFGALPEGEWQPVDHVILLVPDASVCGSGGQHPLSAAERIRRTCAELMRSHFPHRPGRVEFLPAVWRQAPLIDSRLMARLMPTSVPRLRRLLGDSLAAGEARRLVEAAPALAAELCRLRALFAARNPGYSGGFSIVGHGLGGVLVFDLVEAAGLAVKANGSETLAAVDGDIEAETVADDIRKESVKAVLERLGLSDLADQFEQEQIDLETLQGFTEQDAKDLSLPLGPRKKLLAYAQGFSAPAAAPAVPAPPAAIVAAPCASLDFTPGALFALGCPLAFFLAARGRLFLGAEFRLPGGTGLFNIFHPLDPLAFRLEPLLPQCPARPCQLPHHKGRKRLHLELRDGLARVGADIKARLVDSLRSTWASLQGFAQAHRSAASTYRPDEDQQLDSLAAELLGDSMQQRQPKAPADSDGEEQESLAAALNNGRRVDFALQESPIETFNEYLFAVGSHAGYWSSEDTALAILREVYLPLGVRPAAQTTSTSQSRLSSMTPPPLPPPNSTVALSVSISNHLPPPPPAASASTFYRQPPPPSSAPLSNFCHQQPPPLPPSTTSAANYYQPPPPPLPPSTTSAADFYYQQPPPPPPSTTTAANFYQPGPPPPLAQPTVIYQQQPPAAALFQPAPPPPPPQPQVPSEPLQPQQPPPSGSAAAPKPSVFGSGPPLTQKGRSLHRKK